MYRTFALAPIAILAMVALLSGCGGSGHTFTIEGVLTDAEFKTKYSHGGMREEGEYLELTFDGDRRVEVEPEGQFIVVVNKRQLLKVEDGRITNVTLYEPVAVATEEEESLAAEVRTIQLKDIPDAENVIHYKAPEAATVYNKADTFLVDGVLTEIVEGVDRTQNW